MAHKEKKNWKIFQHNASKKKCWDIWDAYKVGHRGKFVSLEVSQEERTKFNMQHNKDSLKQNKIWCLAIKTRHK